MTRSKALLKSATFLTTVVVVALLTMPLHGDYIYWDHAPATPGDWFDPFNWNPDGVPTASDYAIIDNGGTIEITTDSALSERLMVGYSNNGSGTVVQSGGTYTGYSVQLGNPYENYARGRYVISDGSLMTDYLSIRAGKFETERSSFEQSGGSVEVNGTLNLHGGGRYVLNDGTVTIGTANMPSGEFVQNGGVATINDTLRLEGTARYELNDGTLSVGKLETSYGGELIQNGGTCFASTGVTDHESYRLNDGELFSTTFYASEFWHMGGIHTATDLSIGAYYELGGTGQLFAVNEVLESGSSNYGSRFSQTGGTNTISGYLDIGGSREGRYEWFGGELYVHELQATTKSTLAMGFDFNVADIVSGSLLHTPAPPDIRPITLGVTNGATATHDSAELQVNALRLGSYAGEGTYNLSGTGVVRANREYIGQEGIGTFNQTGGANYVAYDLYLGYENEYYPKQPGFYNLSGDGILEAQNEYIGYDPEGTFTQTGGTNTIADSLYLGSVTHPGGEGIYELGGTGQLISEKEYVGEDGIGTFRQTGGTNTVGSFLYLGFNSGSEGTYELSGTGQLTAPTVYVGKNGHGEFRQSGGSAAFKHLAIGSDGRYDFTGGTLEISRQFGSQGTFDCGAQTVTLSAPVSGFVDISSGVFSNMSGASFLGGPESLLIYDVSSPPSTVFGSVSTTGLTHQQGTTLFIPEGQTITGWGDIVGHVDCQGTVSNGGDGAVHIAGGVFVSGSGQADLGGSVKVENSISGMSGGTLSAVHMTVGETGTGQFLQSGGESSFSHSLYLGQDPGSQGTCELSGTGSIQAVNVRVGDEGHGVFSQSAGTFEVSDDLVLSYAAGSQGEYFLSGGSLSVTGVDAGHHMWIGYGAPGAFTHTGGVSTIQGLFMARTEGLTTYQLSGTAELSTVFESISHGRLNGTSTATFTQTGGTHTVSNFLTLGVQSGATGIYTISGGSLNVGTLRVGGTVSGSGIFDMEDPAAEVTITDALRLGPDSTFHAVPGSTIHMTGSAFENQNTDPTDLAGLANLHLIYDGHTGETDPFELAGTDLGRDPDGFIDNFALGAITLEHDSILQLVDDFDNAHRGGVGGTSEALYLEKLTLEAGGILDLNGKHLYIADLDYQGGCIINGDLISMIPGDANGNFCVDGADLAAWQSNYDPLGNNPNTFAMGDWNGDSVINGADLALWQSYYDPLGPGMPGLTGMPEVVPEPGTMLLLGTGVLTLIGLVRRRSL